MVEKLRAADHRDVESAGGYNPGVRSTIDIKQINEPSNIPVISKGFVRRSIEEFPSQVAQLAALPVLVTCLSLSGGFNAFRQVGASIVAGDPIGGIALAGVSIYALLATASIAQIKEGMRASGHDRAEAAKTAELAKALDRIERLQEQSRKQEVTQNDITQIRGNLDQLVDRIDRQTHEYVWRNAAERHTRKNSGEVWANFARGSVLYTVNGSLRFDVNSELRTDGSIRLVPDYKRLASWLKRYGPNGVSRANLVVFADDLAGVTSTNVTPQISSYLIAFRALRQLAKAHHVQLRLDCIRFYLQKNVNARQSFFVGSYNFGEKNVELVICYSDFASMFNVPRTMLDDDVEIDYSPDAVVKYRHLAEVLMAGAPSLSLEDLEKRYGHLVPNDTLIDEKFLKASRGANDACDEEDMIDEIIENGDHFTIRRRSR